MSNSIPPINDHGKWSDWERDFYEAKKENGSYKIVIITLNMWKRILRYVLGSLSSYENTIFTPKKIQKILENNEYCKQLYNEQHNKISEIAKKYKITINLPAAAASPASLAGTLDSLVPNPPRPSTVESSTSSRENSDDGQEEIRSKSTNGSSLTTSVLIDSDSAGTAAASLGGADTVNNNNNVNNSNSNSNNSSSTTSISNDHCLSIGNKTGTLTLTKDVLNQLNPDEFWTNIEKQGIQRLDISLGDKLEIYDKGFLKLLLGNKPPIEELTEKYTLQFEDGNITMPKAKLRLCGEYFETLFRSEMKEAIEKSIKFDDISLNGFRDILRAIETEEYDFDKYPEEFKVAAQYLEFSVSLELPEEYYGQEEWEKHWGNVGEVPLPPKELLVALKGPCPIYNKEGIADGPKMGDTHIIFWRPPTVDDKPLTVDGIEKIATSEKFGENKLKYEYCYSKIRKDAKVNQPIKEGYWFAMLKMPNDFVEKTRNMTYQEQKTYLEQNLPKEYGFPTVCEALIYCLMPRARTGAFVLGRGDPWTLTRCEEEVGGYHVIVGGAAHSGLIFLCDSNDAFRIVCVVPVRKFFRS